MCEAMVIFTTDINILHQIHCELEITQVQYPEPLGEFPSPITQE